ncbi:MAG: Stp1/IreP family PP2C-type Ser/Thr phosphatase [Tannerella sp.]|jgi:protein phosphatase|nr:Stp1/IreP family PP2C-type Ser/Thr phosphatase [Tannerella sp.]
MFEKKIQRKLAHIPSGRLCIRAVTLSDTGCVRSNNEDRAAFLFLDGSWTDFFAILADGMGGYERGEVASATMVDIVCDDNGRTLRRNSRRWMKELFRRANRHIYGCARQLQSVMGTTCSMLLIRNRRVYCSHIGDSRIYLLTDGWLQQLTSDHTVVGEMMRRGEITREEAAMHPQRNILTKAIGTAPDVEPDTFTVTALVKAGSRFLLCSDGLYDLVPDAEIRRLLSLPSLKAAAASLVNEAKTRGGYDNVTAVIAEINDKLNILDNEASHA